jgi:acetylornithine deacetylase
VEIQVEGAGEILPWWRPIGHHARVDATEQRVCAEIARREHDLVELLRDLVRLDTTTHMPGDAPRDEVALQELLAGRLRTAGAAVDLWEPDVTALAGHPMVADGFSFAGRPQMVARFAGTGTGRTLLFNGHVDVVSVEPRDRWPHDPFEAVVSDGAVHGRGACDMKGGVACMVMASEVLASLGVRLAGDLLVNTVTEEESTGAGGLAMAHALHADGAIVPEPSGFEVWIACRGSLLSRITVQGRAGHAGIAPLHPDQGGAVNAIEKMGILLEAVRRLREEWALRPRHPYLSPADCVPTIISGGEWIVSYPASCTLDCHIEFLPDQADERGYGSRVEAVFTDWIARAAAADPWLAAHPPAIEWIAGTVPPAEVSPDDPLVQAALGAVAAIGRTPQLGGLDNWHDGATLVAEAGIPAICLGPGDIAYAHTTDERVPIADLVSCTQALAIAAMRFCGVAG